MTGTVKRVVHKFDFGKEASHIALVDKASNLQTVLTMKAQEDEVQVTLSMKNFLKKFFNLWEEDAAILAGIMGYSSEVYDKYKNEDGTYMSDDEFISSKIESVQLLKGLDLDKTIPSSISLKVEELIKQFGDELKTSGVSQEDTHNVPTGDPKLDTTEIKVEELEILKAASKEVDLLKSQMAAMKEAMDTKAKLEMVELVKGYSFITEDKQEGIAEFLIKSEGSAVVLEVLEKARDAIAAIALDEQGTEGAEKQLEVELSDLEKSASLVSGILKARKS